MRKHEPAFFDILGLLWLHPPVKALSPEWLQIKSLAAPSLGVPVLREFQINSVQLN
jgi:hypothetical protein